MAVPLLLPQLAGVELIIAVTLLGTGTKGTQKPQLASRLYCTNTENVSPKTGVGLIAWEVEEGGPVYIWWFLYQV